MAQKFKTGDIVQLKSGGPEMTVKEYKRVTKPDLTGAVSDNELICEWFDKNELKTGYFHQDSLENIDE